mmetsp:Transcript_171265/g.544054  ORF Transcript_171265/g.544054 Transcript_171265/m.544054 type:complete len:150 (-) Transcript_171265:8-457(-)
MTAARGKPVPGGGAGNGGSSSRSSGGGGGTSGGTSGGGGGQHRRRDRPELGLAAEGAAGAGRAVGQPQGGAAQPQVAGQLPPLGPPLEGKPDGRIQTPRHSLRRPRGQSGDQAASLRGGPPERVCACAGVGARSEGGSGGASTVPFMQR